MKVDPHYQQQKDTSVYVEFNDVQIVYRFARRVSPNLHFKVVLFFNVK